MAARIDLGEPTNRIKALLRRKKATRWIVVALSGIHDASVSQLLERLKVVGEHLRKLERVDFSIQQSLPFPVRAVGKLLSLRADTIQQVNVTRNWTFFYGTRDDYRVFFEALGRCKNLRGFQVGRNSRFNVSNLTPHGGTDLASLPRWEPTSRWVSDSIVSVLSGMEQLERVELSDCFDCSNQSLSRLCQRDPAFPRKPLVLSIFQSAISKEQLEAMLGKKSRITDLETGAHIFHTPRIDAGLASQHLAQNPSLKTFRAQGGGMPLAAATRILGGLEQNSVVETAALDAFVGSGEAALFECDLPNAVARMGSLKKLHLRITIDEQDSYLGVVRALLCGLTQNRSLEVLDVEIVEIFRGRGMTGLELSSMVKSLHGKQFAELEASLAHNYAMKRFDLKFRGSSGGSMEVHFPWSFRTHFWLKLNRAGRKELEERPNDFGLWIDTIIDQRQRTDVVFELLSRNPAVVCLGVRV